MSTATRGFASMSKEQRAAAGRIGALAAHQCGRAYRWNSKTASEAGRRGGVVAGRVRRAKRERIRDEQRRRLEKPVVVPTLPAPVLLPPVPSPSSPLMLFAEHLKKVVSDALKGA